MAVAGSWPAHATAINLISNGSFESGSNGAALGDWVMEAPGSTDITGWSVVSTNIDWVNGFWLAADGTHSLDLNGNLGPSGVAQTIATVPGQLYHLSFSFSGNPNLGTERGIAGDLLASLSVSAGPVSNEFAFDVLPTQSNANMDWVTASFDFTADSNATLVQFISTTTLPLFPRTSGDPPTPNCCYGPVIDNVSVTDVPEPSSLAVFGCAFIALSLLGRRRALSRICAYRALGDHNPVL